MQTARVQISSAQAVRPRGQRARAAQRVVAAATPKMAQVRAAWSSSCPAPANHGAPSEGYRSLQGEQATRVLARLAGAALVASLGASPALAADMAPAPVVQAAERKVDAALASSSLAAPAVTEAYQLPEGASWRYSDFIKSVEKGKVERVRFSKDGSALQLTAVDGCVLRRAGAEQA